MMLGMPVRGHHPAGGGSAAGVAALGLPADMNSRLRAEMKRRGCPLNRLEESLPALASG